jgi:hypothetical protein
MGGPRRLSQRMRATLQVTRGSLLAAGLISIATAWDMPSYLKRVTHPCRKALIGGYRGMRSALRDRLPPGAARRTDHIFIAAYVIRAEARPAFKRAFAAQLAVFTAASASR